MLHVVGTLPDNQFGLRTEEEALDCDVCWYEGMISDQAGILCLQYIYYTITITISNSPIRYHFKQLGHINILK